MHTVRNGRAVGLLAQVALLAALGMTVGLSVLGWVVGLTCCVAMHLAVALAVGRSGSDALGPADLVTLTRGTLACGAAALVGDAFLQPSSAVPLVALSAAALVLDAVDGWVARRTRTATLFGARFDGEIDAFLILVLSVYVARSLGAWVLAIGAMRYVFAVAGWAMPAMRVELPPRYWRKVVAGTQGVVLTLAAAEVMSHPLTVAALVVALALLTESFGRDVWWLWRMRSAERPDGTPRRRAYLARMTDVLALLLVWFALVAPNHASGLTPGQFVRIPLEGLVVAGLALVLPSRARRATAVVVGVLLGLLTFVKALDVGFFAAFDRPFDLATDRGYLVPSIDLVRNAVGPAGAIAIFVVAAVFVVAVLVGLPLAVSRLTELVARNRSRSVRTVIGLAVVWAGLAVSGLQIVPAEPIASASTSRIAVGHVGAIAAGVHDQQRFEAAAAVDAFGDTGKRQLLTGLRGKDVLLVFVESYGRSAISSLPGSPRVRAVLDAGTRRLRASGYSSRSAFLTSPTFGGLSWLAHATLQSGLWVDNQQRHDRLLSTNRMTLTRAFHRAGWQTLAVMSQNDEKWLEGKAFYRFDTIFDREDIGYRGPKFGWSAVPDQYALSAFQHQILAERERGPVMAEIDLTSSHPPWAPLPRMVAWRSLGDGSVYDRIHRRSQSAAELWRHPENVAAAYVDSIVYSLSACISFVEKYGDDDLVLVIAGDHQPAAVVTGSGASRDVPITVVAGDPSVIDRISGWGWQDGMRPDSRAPVWPMDAFRDRLLDAFSRPLPSIRSAVAVRGPGHVAP